MSKIVKHKDAQSFLKMSGSFLQEYETRNNLLIGLANQMINTQRELDGGELFYSLIENDNVVGCALRSNLETPLTITKIKKESLPVLIKKLRTDEVKLIGINGEIQTVKDFVGFYGIKTKVHMHLGLYELHEVIPPNIKGEGRLATMDDLEVATGFLRGFLIDCFDDDSEEKARKMMIRNLTHGKVYLWFDGERAVSMAAKTREGLHGAAISLVYTSPEDRGRGYGRAATALCAQEILNSGKSFCYLHTDMKNPVSNLIYQKIGFVKVGESMHYDFIP